MNEYLSTEIWRGSLVETKIVKAAAQGAFENLSGCGRPLDLDGPHDPEWWTHHLVERGGLSILPPTLQIRLDAQRIKQQALEAPSEEVARGLLEELNERIARQNRLGAEGPPTSMSMLDVERVLALRLSAGLYAKR